MHKAWLRNFLGVAYHELFSHGFIRIIIIVGLIFGAAGIATIAFGPKNICGVFYSYQSEEILICNNKPWHGMLLENDLVNIQTYVSNHGHKLEHYTLLPKVYFGANPNKTAEVPERLPLEIPPGESRFYQFYGHLEQGRWKMDITLENATQTNRNIIASIRGYDIFVQPTQDFFNALIAYGTIGGSVATASALLSQILYSRRQNNLMQKTLEHDKDVRWSETYESHSQQLSEELAKNWSANSQGNPIQGFQLFSNVLDQNGEINHLMAREPTGTYSICVKSHLKLAYTSTWTLYLEALAESKTLSDETLKTIDAMKNTISRFIESKVASAPRLEQWDANRERFYYAIDRLTASLISEFKMHDRVGYPTKSDRQAVRPGIRQSDGSVKSVDLVHLRVNTFDIARGRDEDMDKLQPVIDELIVSPPEDLKKQFQTYLSQAELLDHSDKQNAFFDQISEIIDEINGGLPIKGEGACYICMEKHDEIYGKDPRNRNS